MSEERWLLITPSKLVFAISPRRTVAIQLGYEGTELGLAPGVKLAVDLTPAEARSFAMTLLRKANEAEGKESLAGLDPRMFRS